MLAAKTKHALKKIMQTCFASRWILGIASSQIMSRRFNLADPPSNFDVLSP